VSPGINSRAARATTPRPPPASVSIRPKLFMICSAHLADLPPNIFEESRARLDRELTAIKPAPFQSRRRRVPNAAVPGEPKKPGRKPGHPGSGRVRPSRIDRVAVITAGEHYERIIQDLAAYCEQLFLTNEGGEDREQSLHYLKSNFLPNSTIAIAYQSDKTLREG